ncbi:THUMP domain-containing protein 1 [Geranomyces michiganensis]|nr:THUMP domain-containing protein 1 [Geranomyces michiganensis]
MDKFYGNHGIKAENHTDEEGDVSDLLAKELAELKRAPEDTKQQFSWIKTNMDCIVFLQTYAPIEPADFVHKILTDLNESKKKKTRYTQRIHPVQNTCRAFEDKIKAMAKPLLAPHFEGKKGIKWAVESRVKGNASIKRQEVIDAIASNIGPDHVVDLTNPEITVIVELLQNVCSIAVVKDYQELRKFNLELIHDGEEKKARPATTENASDAKTEDAGDAKTEDDRFQGVE